MARGLSVELIWSQRALCLHLTAVLQSRRSSQLRLRPHRALRNDSRPQGPPPATIEGRVGKFQVDTRIEKATIQRDLFVLPGYHFRFTISPSAELHPPRSKA